MQPDTLIPDPANPQSWNRYSYVGNNPVNFNDPTGHKECDPEFGCEGKLPKPLPKPDPNPDDNEDHPHGRHDGNGNPDAVKEELVLFDTQAAANAFLDLINFTPDGFTTLATEIDVLVWVGDTVLLVSVQTIAITAGIVATANATPLAGMAAYIAALAEAELNSIIPLGVGNVLATTATGIGGIADIANGNTRFYVSIDSSQSGYNLNVNAKLSGSLSNSVAITGTGWIPLAPPVELSWGLQTAAVANDLGKLPPGVGVPNAWANYRIPLP